MSRQFTEEEFKQLAKEMKKLLRLQHHLTHVNSSPNTPLPRRFSKLQTDLIQQIRPAYSNQETDLHKKYNAENFVYTTIQILEDHYKEETAASLEKIKLLQHVDWKKALEVATRWLRKDIRNLKEATLEETRRKLVELFTKPKNTTTSNKRSSTETLGNQPLAKIPKQREEFQNRVCSNLDPANTNQPDTEEIGTKMQSSTTKQVKLVDKQPTAVMADEKPKEAVKTENNELINLKVVAQDGSVVRFKIGRHSPLSKLMNAYCKRRRLFVKQTRFRFDGQPIKETDTPSQLEMEDEDVIDVFQQQDGGSPL